MILLFNHHNLKYCAIRFMQGLPSKSADKPNKPKSRVILITPEKSLLIIPKTQGDASLITLNRAIGIGSVSSV